MTIGFGDLLLDLSPACRVKLQTNPPQAFSHKDSDHARLAYICILYMY
jgi:hypothetical protein